MQTLAENIPNSIGYVRCGEILKPQKGFQNPYILRCIQCKEIYLLLESFIFHLNDSCKKEYGAKKNIQELNCSSDEAEVINEPLECEESPVKLEYSGAQMEDPLIVVKNENDIEESFIKIEPSSIDESKNFKLETITHLSFQNDETSLDNERECESQVTEPEETEIIQKPSNVNIASSSFVSNFMKSEENIAVLIAAFKNQQQLWNKTITQITESNTNVEGLELNDRINITDVKVKESNFPMQTEVPLIGENSSDGEECTSFKEENLDNIDDIELQSSVEGIENSSDNSLSSDDDGDDIYEIRVRRQLLIKKKQTKSNWDCTKKQSVFVNQFLETKTHVTALIEAYKNQPSLWNKNFPFLRSKLKRQNCLQQIANGLNEQHNLSLNLNQVANVIVYLCRKYREDLKGIKESKADEEYIPAWFFENLNFLKPFVENNPIAKLDSHMPDLLPSQIIEILEIYKGLPHLWNTQLIEHYCKNKIYAAKQEMLKVLEMKMGLKITEHILEDYFRTINNCFTRAKRKNEDKKLKKDNDTNIEDNAQEDYYEHMIFLYDHVGSFKCTECKCSFKSPLYLKTHQTQFHGSEPLSCSICKKLFKNVSSFTYHAKRHMKDLNHECKECGKKFLRSNALRIHMRNHSGVKPFCCEICGASFRYLQGFNNHHRRHIKNYVHTCQICNKGFYSKDRYNDHMNSHSNIRSQVCNVCGKAFITKASLKQHVVIHDEIRRHACKLCGKTFKHKTRVNHHMKTHGIANSDEKSTANKE